MNANVSILGAIVWFGACAALIGVGWYRRNWIVLAIGALLLAISVWNTLALIRGPNSN